MKRYLLFLDLRDDPALIADYEAHHAADAVPPAIVRSIRDAGILNMEIFRSGNRLAMLMEAEDGFDPAARALADRTSPEVIAWEALMDRFQQRLPWAQAGEKWLAGQRIFSLEEQRP
jgi:L-rhamnose mutarotase